MVLIENEHENERRKIMHAPGDITNDQIGNAGFNPFLELSFSKEEAQRITAAVLTLNQNDYTGKPERTVTDLICSGLDALLPPSFNK